MTGDCQAMRERGSGISHSQGLLAPRPSKNRIDGMAINTRSVVEASVFFPKTAASFSGLSFLVDLAFTFFLTVGVMQKLVEIPSYPFKKFML